MLLCAVPIWYAAARFGLRGSLPTALWSGALLLAGAIGSAHGLALSAEAALIVLLASAGVSAGLVVDLKREAVQAAETSDGLLWIARISDQLPDGVSVTDSEGRVTYGNQAWARLLGFQSAGGMLGRHLTDLHHHHSQPRVALGESGSHSPKRIEHRRPDGSTYWLEVTAAPLRDDLGQVMGRVSVVREVTDQVRTELALREAEERFRLTFERAPVAMALVSPEGRFLQVNRSLCDLLTYDAETLLATSVVAITHPEDLNRTRQGLSDSALYLQLLKRFIRSDGTPITVRVSRSVVRGPSAQERYYVVQYWDMTAEERSRRELTRRAFHDALTGLPNRLLFYDRTQHALIRSERGGQSVAVLFCDLDRFKEVNDRRGHAFGDLTLKAVAARISEVMRSADTVARFGGDEFLVLLDELGDRPETRALSLARRLQVEMGRPVVVEGQSLQIGASVGVAISKGGGTDVDRLVREADAAMYEAKRSGGGGVRLAAPASSPISG